MGHFYGGDCYLLLYTYLIGEKQHYLLYIWQVSTTPAPGPEHIHLSSYSCQVAIALELNTSADGELTPFPSWDCFGCKSPLTLSPPHSPPFSLLVLQVSLSTSMASYTFPSPALTVGFRVQI